MDAEAHEPEEGQGQQAQPGAGGRPQPLASTRGAEHQEGEDEPRRDLDADSGHQGRRTRAEAGARARGKGKRERQQEQDHGVVVCAADGEDEQHRVQAHERRGPAGGVSKATGRARDERDCAEARCCREHLQRPQATRDAERGGGVADDREQRAIRGVLERPSHELEDRVGARFGGDVGVWVKAVQGPHAREGEVAEDVLGDQRRPEQQRSRARARSRRPARERVALGRRGARAGSSRT